MMLVRWLAMCVGGLLVLVMVGCGGYELRGRVVPGGYSGVMVVDATQADVSNADATAGIPGAMVTVTVDPDRTLARALPAVRTEPDGCFSVPIAGTGVGMLEYRARVVVRLAGHSPATGEIRVPGGDGRVLVTLAPGADRVRGGVWGEESPEAMIERYWRD